MSYPATPLDVVVEAAFGADLTANPSTWTWTDITTHVLLGDGIGIWRGRRPFSAVAEPTEITFTLNNFADAARGRSAGDFTPRYAASQYYPYVRRGTPIRVTVEGSVRATALAQSWTPTADISGRHLHVRVTANGVLRRLSKSRATRSALYRYVFQSPPTAYWPLEDGFDTSQGASAIDGVPAMTVRGAVSFGTALPPPGSASVVDLTGGGQLIGTVPTSTATSYRIELVAQFPVLAPGEFVAVMQWYTPSGGVDFWELDAADLSGGGLYIQRFTNSSGATALYDSGVLGNVADGLWHHIRIDVEQSGGDINIVVTLDGNDVISQTVAGFAWSQVSRIFVNPTGSPDELVPAIGHIAVWKPFVEPTFYSAFYATDAMRGWAGETASTRLLRIANAEETGLGVWLLSDDANEVDDLMGPQTPNTVLAWLRECEAVNSGVLFEPTDPTAHDRLLSYLGRVGIENQTSALTLDYSSGQVAFPLEPVLDDQGLVNDVTASRPSGSSQRYLNEDSIVAEGGASYDRSLTVNTYTDDMLGHFAGWATALGSAAELRIPTARINLLASPELIADWLATDIGSRITTTNVPVSITPDGVDIVLDGYTEIVRPPEWTADLNGSPFTPWEIFILGQDAGVADDFLGRLVPDSMTLLVARDNDDTSFTVATVPAFSTTSDDYPMTVTINGEDITLTSCAAVTASYVATGTADQQDNAATTPGMPGGSTAAGDLLLLLAACRATTGSPATPSGWTLLADASNLKLFGRYWDGSFSAPTVTYTGTTSGDTCSAQIASLRGVSMEVLYSASQANASAQDIALPQLLAVQIADEFSVPVQGAVIVHLGQKADDWTSVTPVSPFTELGDTSSTSGNDQGITWAARFLTTPTNASGSFTVTGGASAVSRSAMVVLRSNVYTLTATRSVNGIVKSHAQLSELVLDTTHLGL